MPYFHYDDIKISGIASAVPTQTISIDHFAEEFGQEMIERFSKMTGVKQFHKSLPHQTASDLGYAAAERILNTRSIDRDEIGALIFIAHSVDYRRPATACVLHKRLKLSKECAAIDIGLGCSATVYGLETAASMMACSDIKKALLITGETLTKMVHPKDKSVAMLFGDGGSAILLEKEAKNRLRVLLRTDGHGYKSIIAPAGGYRNIDATHEEFVWPDGNIRTLYNTYMNGTDVFSFTISEVPESVRDFLKHSNSTLDEYDCFAFHQANQYIHKQLAKKLSIPFDKMPLCIDKYGNTSAPAVTIALCDKYGETKDEIINTMFCCFGVGLSWGVATAKINTNCIYPVIETDEIFTEGIINNPF